MEIGGFEIGSFGIRRKKMPNQLNEIRKTNLDPEVLTNALQSDNATPPPTGVANRFAAAELARRKIIADVRKGYNPKPSENVEPVYIRGSRENQIALDEAAEQITRDNPDMPNIISDTGEKKLTNPAAPTVTAARRFKKLTK